jgi:hypothetical protein
MLVRAFQVELRLSILKWDIFVVCVTSLIKMKWNRSLNTTNGLLAKMESG